MNYYNLKSIVAATKKSFPMRVTSESFYLAGKREKPYIQPSFVKVLSEAERPAVILISAVGATGKTTLAQVLSNDTNLPLLDLGKHKPVGDNTLTGLLTSTYKTEDLSQIFLGLADGSYAVIIDGIDEGRSKTTEKAFEAFLDDISRLCASSTNTSFVLLGRTRIVEDCWLYLSEKGTSTALFTISPFDLISAREYIDTYTGAREAKFQAQYEKARDYILDLLAKAFVDNTKQLSDDFLSFIGYPPVLDAIVTLLGNEPNYYKLLTQLQYPDANDVEIALLHRIAQYILQREKDQKVRVNILDPLVAEMPSHERVEITQRAFEAEEQCLRLVAFCLNKKLSLQIIAEQVLNEKYEEQLLAWLPEHPFVSGTRFRNVVFEATALATAINSRDPQHTPLIREYLHSHKYSYHLIYLLSTIAQDGFVPIEYLQAILGSALEFRSTNASVELTVDGPEADEVLPGNIEIEIEILLGRDKNVSKTFVFRSSLSDNATVNLGDHLSSTYVSLPCRVSLSGGQDIELTAPVEICADRIALESRALILKQAPKANPEESVILQARSIESTLESIATNGVAFKLAVAETDGLTYPVVQYAEKRAKLPSDSLIQEKYLRLRRILMAFRSHGRGTLARYKPKIDDERVLQNNVGRAILRQLLNDGILTMSGDHYFLQPEGIDRYLGITWLDLRMGKTSDKLIQYLRSVNCDLSEA
jgi:hypothetical protein